MILLFQRSNEEKNADVTTVVLTATRVLSKYLKKRIEYLLRYEPESLYYMYQVRRGQLRNRLGYVKFKLVKVRVEIPKSSVLEHI